MRRVGSNMKTNKNVTGRVKLGRAGSGQEMLNSHGSARVRYEHVMTSRVGSGHDLRETVYAAEQSTLTRDICFR